MSRTFVAASCFLSLTAAAAAQLLPGAITAGNVQFGYNTFPSSPIATGGTANFRSAGVAGPDHLQEAWWYYRLGGDVREYTFHNGAGQGLRTSSYSAGVAVLAWDNVDHRGISARLVTSIYSAGPTAGVAVQEMRVTNLTLQPITLDLFAFVDQNQSAGLLNDALPNPDGMRQRIVTPGWPTIGEIYVPDADCYQVAPSPVLRSKFANSVIDHLNDSGLPMLAQDYSGAWQWESRVLLPGQSLSARIVFAQDFSHSGNLGKAVSQTYGNAKAGTNGLPTWSPTSQPLLGTTARLRIENGLTGAFAFGIVGLAPASLALPGFGTLLVDPNVGLTTMLLNPFDAARTSDTPFTIPNIAELGGLPLHWQAGFLDAGAYQGVAHTNGLAWKVGGRIWPCGCTGFWAPAPAVPCVPGMVVETANATAVCFGGWGNWCSWLSPCTLTREWKCNAAGTAWDWQAEWESGC